MKQKSKNKSLIRWGLPLSFVLMIIAVILLLIFFMQGETKIVGNYPENITSELLTCVKQNNNYPFFKYRNSNSEETKISAVFANKKIDSISLIHTIDYSNHQDAETSKASNMASMNKSFGQEFGPGAFNARYIVNGNSMQMNLYAKSNEIRGSALKYFLAESYPATMSDYEQNYLSQGFNCEKNKN